MAELDESVYLNAARAYCQVQFSYDPGFYTSDEGRQRAINADAAITARDPFLRAAVESVWEARGAHDAAAIRAKANEMVAGGADTYLTNGMFDAARLVVSTTPTPGPEGEGARTLRADLADEADWIDERGGMISAAWVADAMRHLAQYGHRRPRAGESTHIHNESTHIHNAPAALDGGQTDG